MDQIFVDGVGSITVIGPTVRLDFVVLSPTEKDAKGQPQAVLSKRMVMTVDAFARMTGKMQETLQALSKLSQMPRDAARAENSNVEAVQIAAAEPPVDVTPSSDETPPRRRPFP